MVLIKLSEESLSNMLYYVLAIQCILKFEYIKDGNEFENKIDLEKNEVNFIIFSDTKITAQENMIHSKNFIHQISIAFPNIKHLFKNGNEYFEELIDTSNKQIACFILYNLAYYNIIINKTELLLCLSNYPNNNCTFVYPERIITDSIINIIKQKFGIIDYKKITTNDELINKRFINI